MLEKTPSPVEQAQAVGPPQMRRPLSVTIVVLAVLMITAFGLLRLFEALQQWDFLSSLPGISPLYLALTGLVWGLTGLVVAWLLWRGAPQAPRIFLIFIIFYLLTYWLDRLLMANPGQGPLFKSNWPFQACLSAYALFQAVLILRIRSFAAYFRRRS